MNPRVSERMRELIAELRHNAEEWGATMEPAWLDRVTETEQKIADAISSLEKDAERLDWLSDRNNVFASVDWEMGQAMFEWDPSGGETEPEERTLRASLDTCLQAERDEQHREARQNALGRSVDNLGSGEPT